MRSLAHSRGVATGLLGVSAFVCFGLWGFATPSAPPPETPRAIETTSADAGQDLAQLTQAVAARPVFQPSRRPAATAAAAPAPVAAETTISLIGIVTDGDRNIALMRLSGSSQLHRVEAGMELDRWTIHAIDANGAALSKEGEEPYILDINK